MHAKKEEKEKKQKQRDQIQRPKWKGENYLLFGLLSEKNLPFGLLSVRKKNLPFGLLSVRKKPSVWFVI